MAWVPALTANSHFTRKLSGRARGAGKWLQVNGDAIYAIHPRDGENWSEEDSVRYTQSKDKRFVYATFT